ncbi:MAPEG family protein [Caulobacter sp. 73W]|uniref:MAPEG family protein n=1 Tax=Caulobacter sp. 73W TaxID=3161137 RepID=A0AB39KWK6_9CAUL
MNSILTPVLALVAWSLVVWLWMYATRIPAMQKARIEPQSARFPGSLAVLPDGVRQVADNYNHLMEQPTIFYALAVYVHLAGQGDGTNIGLAWAYVGLRVAHSLVQGTVNLVMARFALFSLSTIALIVITAREVLKLV